MRPSEALAKHRESIRRIVEAHHVQNARVFGSVLHGQDTEGRDLDVLIDPTPETTLFDIGAIRRGLTTLLGVPVDVLTPNALPENFRARVLLQAIPI
jgi:predicted nucleotidyltransferase